MAACRRILEEIGEAERAATGEYAVPKGELVVTAPIVFGRLHVVPVVAEFLAHYPEININLMLTDRVVHLMDESGDAAIRIGELPDSTLMANEVGTVRRVICASPAAPASAHITLTRILITSPFTVLSYNAVAPCDSVS